jgi:hypothetical protein
VKKAIVEDISLALAKELNEQFALGINDGYLEPFAFALQKKIKNLTGELARTGLIYAVSCKVVNPSFANQTKTKINNPELRGLASKAFSEGFKKFCLQYPNEEKKIEDFLTKEEKAEKARDKFNSITGETSFKPNWWTWDNRQNIQKKRGLNGMPPTTFDLGYGS